MADRKPPLKAELAEANEILQEENTALKDKLETLEDMVDEKMALMEEKLANMRNAGEAVPQADVEPIYEDPFDGQYGHKIKADPPGFRLGWKNEKMREPSMGGSRGWRGWEPITYDDDIGRNLSEYLAAPPARMEGSSQLDNKVRRGDTILCKLPEEIWLARQRKRTDKDAARRGVAAGARNRQIQPGVVTTGDGLKDDTAANSNTVPGTHRTNMLDRQ